MVSFNPDVCGVVHDKSVEDAVGFLTGYMLTYPEQPSYKDYMITTFLDDMLYGIGVSVCPDEYTGADGYEHFKVAIVNYIEGMKACPFKHDVINERDY